MTALDLVTQLRAMGVELEPVGDAIRIRPASAVPVHLKEQLRACKAEVIVLLRAGHDDQIVHTNQTAITPEDRRRTMPIFALKVPGVDDPVWFVPNESAAEALMKHEGVTRGHIWTAGELMDLFAIKERPRDLAATLARAKLALDGDIVETRARTAG